MNTTDTAALTSDLPELMDILLVQKAAGIAALAHDGQTDKAGRPYVEHVHRVAAAVDTGLERAVALLHDVVEDTEWGEVDLMAAGMPREVVSAVLALTHAPHEPRTDYYGRVRAAGPLAVKVKLADVADNSAPERLAYLDATTRERLERKYAKARAALTDPEETP